MAKWITLALVATLLFSAGLYAGSSVRFSNVLAIGPTQSKSAPSLPVLLHQNISDHAANGSATKINEMPITFISAELVADAEVRTAEFNDLGATDVTSADDSDITVADSERAAIRNLILQHFPNTESDLAEIWVETFAGMDLDEINFILEQKKQSSSGLGSGLSVLPGSSQPSIAGPLTSTSESAVDEDVALVTTNLRSAYSIGYRRMVVLPEAVDPSTASTDSGAVRGNIPTTRFRTFESGPLLQSPIATHVALSNETSVMFHLEGNHVTRRGDFQILTDNRLGIVTGSGEFAAEGSTPLPEDAKDVHILQNGTIGFSNTAGETLNAGRITVCCIVNLAELKSGDGVLFLASGAGQLKVLEHPDSVLRLNSLEQSNVNRVEENFLLEHLKSLSNSSR